MTRVLRGIDVHCFPSTAEYIDGFMARHRDAMATAWGVTYAVETEDAWAQKYLDAGILGLVMTLAPGTTGQPPLSNEYARSVVERFPEVFIGAIGQVDIWSGRQAIADLRRIKQDLDFVGVSFEQQLSEFFPNDSRFYPIWETCQDLGLPVLFHTGMSGYGIGQPGGMGSRLKYTQPIPYIDDVAADFPGLSVVGTHISWPWQEEMIAVARHKANVSLDLSAWLPKHFPASIRAEMEAGLRDRIMFGADHPSMHPTRWIESLRADLDLSEVTRQRILWANAIDVFGLRSRLPPDVRFAL